MPAIDWSSFPPVAPYPGHISPLDLARELKTLANPGASLAFAGVVATLQRGVRSTTIGMIGDSTGDDLTGGADVDEWARIALKKLAADFPVFTLEEERWDDTSQGFLVPAVLRTGTGNGGGDRGVRFSTTTPGSMQYPGAAGPSAALDIRARIAPTTWTAAADRTIAAKWDSGANQRSFLFLLGANGSLALNHSADGAASVGQKTSSVTIPATVNPANGSALWVRATLTLNNGATGHDVRFYTSADGQTWTQLGATQTTAGVTTLFTGTAPYQAGAFTTGNSTPFGGVIHRVVVLGVIDGKQSFVPPLLDFWDNLSTASANLTFVGAPVITFLNASSSGQNVAYFDNATRRPIVHQPRGQDVLIISSAHNDGTQNRAVWLSNYANLVNNAKALLPGVPVLAVAQNEAGVGGTFALNAQDVEHRATRGAMVQRWAASQAGVYSFDAYPYVKPADTIDQLHPTHGPGSGSDKWGTAFYNRLRPIYS